MMVHRTEMQLNIPAAVGIRVPRLRVGRSTRRVLRIVLVSVLAVVIFLINVEPTAAHAPDWRVGVRGVLVNLPSIDIKWLSIGCMALYGCGYVKAGCSPASVRREPVVGDNWQA